MVPMNGPADGRLEAPKAEAEGGGRPRALAQISDTGVKCLRRILGDMYRTKRENETSAPPAAYECACLSVELCNLIEAITVAIRR
jgi:hypothetical protein